MRPADTGAPWPQQGLQLRRLRSRSQGSWQGYAWYRSPIHRYKLKCYETGRISNTPTQWPGWSMLVWKHSSGSWGFAVHAQTLRSLAIYNFHKRAPRYQPTTNRFQNALVRLQPQGSALQRVPGDIQGHPPKDTKGHQRTCGDATSF